MNFFASLLSFGWTIVGWIFNKAIIKFVVLFGIYYLVEALSSAIISFLPSLDSLNQSLAGVPSDIWYFLDLLGFSQGVALIIGAYTSRFLIRRIP